MKTPDEKQHRRSSEEFRRELDQMPLRQRLKIADSLEDSLMGRAPLQNDDVLKPLVRALAEDKDSEVRKAVGNFLHLLPAPEYQFIYDRLCRDSNGSVLRTAERARIRRKKLTYSDARIGRAFKEIVRMPQELRTRSERALASVIKAAVTESRDDSQEPLHRAGMIVTLQEFMQLFCKPTTRSHLAYRSESILTAARRGSVQLPPFAEKPAPGKPFKFYADDLLRAWRDYAASGISLPALKGEYEAA